MSDEREEPAEPEALAASKPRGALWYIGVALAVAASIAVIEGPYLLHDWREARRVERDPHVRGRVLGMRATGDSIKDEPAMEVTVEFETRDGHTVRATTIERVNEDDEKILSSRREIDVWYDAKNPTDVVIRWRPRPR